MHILNRYIFGQIAGTTGLVMAVLLALGGFIEFVGQLDDVGEGNYDLMAAIQYVLLKLPRLAVGLLPHATLLGSLLALGGLAANSELIVMRAAGIPVQRIARSIGLAGLLLALLGGAVGEFMAPQMDLYARQMRAVAKSGEADMAGSSAWLRDGEMIFNLRPSIDGTEYGGVYVFRMDDSMKLRGLGRGDSVESDEDIWSISNYRESVLTDEGVSLREEINTDRVQKLSDLLAITAVRESSLTGAELWAYVRYLESNGLESGRYEIAFWSRLASVVGIGVMCMLALPFVFGSLRTTGAGARLIIGVLIGAGYFLLSRTMAESGAVFDLSPLFVAWFPTALLAFITYVALRRLS